jgi:oxygen-independent coproporphyrinogen-3 oxidase
VYVAKTRDTDPLVDAIAADIQSHRSKVTYRRALDTIYLGGGTPSLMRPDQIGKILQQASTSFGIKPGAEITLEANPLDVIGADLEGLKAAGVNRLSIGLQSLSDSALKFLGRDHDAPTGRAAVRAALKVFPSVSIDLIYARPGQMASSWRTELIGALALGAPHLSLYELTIEERTAFGKAAARGDLVPMGEDAQADLYDLTQQVTDAAGLPAYEVSNHAAGPSFQSQHNLMYWRGGDWMGVGPGAHGRITVDGRRYATLAQPRPVEYLANVQALGSGWGGADALGPLDVARELVSMGLRPVEGLEIGRVEALSGALMDRDKIQTFVDHGWMTMHPGRISLTPAGRLLTDALAVELSP